MKAIRRHSITPSFADFERKKYFATAKPSIYERSNGQQ